ncbi:bifunctional folylpolyglutamate synthase/dihydrofolate synthase [Jeotgalibacillus marinus]|uniref:tetrahydrofolate synthase n=1 Tax=Jeotgalibacillus marinus TaxID=86667 RepID=A0ABV3PZQ6_9BACL
MIHTYKEAIDWIHGRLRLGIKPGLTRMEWIMEQLGHPERNINAIHIGGTNGKGSTVTYLRSIYQASNATVGTFTSPYFETFNERISVNGVPISDDDWLKLTQKIEPLANQLEETDMGGPTEFEVITAMMFLYFGEIHPVDVTLIEVGLGGRFDSTNIVKPLCSIITSIGLDHVAILGSTYEKIAFEKAGIIKEGVPVVLNVKQTSAKSMIEKTSKTKQAPIYSFGNDFSTKISEINSTGERFHYNDRNYYYTFNMMMTGEHQVENASLAIFTALHLKGKLAISVSEKSIHEGIANAYWPGRTEKISNSPTVIMDGAHNKEGIEALLKTLTRKFPDRKLHFLFAAVGDKDLVQMINMLDQAAYSIAFTTFDLPRAATGEELVAMSGHPNKQLMTPLHWIHQVVNEESGDVFVLTGSLYFLSSISFEMKKILNSENKR